MTMGIHIWSTAPRLRLKPELEFQPEYFEVVCLALSALMWRKLNGPIKFYADTPTYDWFKGNDLLDLWDGGVDNTILDQIPETVNQTIFWAGSKLFALRAEPAPVAMVDTDTVDTDTARADTDMDTACTRTATATAKVPTPMKKKIKTIKL